MSKDEPVETILSIRSLTKRFEGLTAIDACDIEVEKGAILGLIGPNGAGKTTLFNIITGLDRPTTGDVFFRGRKITGLEPHARSRLGISRTFQLISLFNGMTVLENVMLGRHSKTAGSWWGSLLKLPSVTKAEKELRLECERILEFVGLDQPPGKKHELAGNLAYGEQRLLEIGRALANQPEILLLDEPGAGMNTSEMLTLEKIIARIHELGITIVFVEHDMKFAMSAAQKIVVLDQGRKVAEGTPREVQTNEQVLEAYLGRSR